MIRTIEIDDEKISLDVSKQRLSVEASPSSLHGLYKSVSGTARDFVSAAILSTKAKQFDDGLYASIEILAQEGTTDFIGKKALIDRIAAILAVEENGLSPADIDVCAASRLAEPRFAIPSNTMAQIEQRLDEFSRNQQASKPVSFYTWSTQLEDLFRQDRLLQQSREAREFSRLVDIIRSDDELKATYFRHIGLNSRLTNELVGASLADWIEFSGAQAPALNGKAHFFPPSASSEGNLIKSLFGNMPIPDGFSLMDEVVKRVKAGTMSLKPDKNHGWYQHQLWSLEPLIVPEKMPESKRLLIGRKYRDKLTSLFKGIFSLTRETHAKQLDVTKVASAVPGKRKKRKKIKIRPRLTVEWLPSFYLRRAWSYRFVKTVLVEAFGEETLSNVFRLRESGPVKQNLLAELDFMVQLFMGAFFKATDELALPLDDFEIPPGSDDEDSQYCFSNWRASIEEDEDLGADTRMMVPVFFDKQRMKTKVWIFMGWTYSSLTAHYDRRPTVKRINGWFPFFSRAKLEFASSSRQAAYPAFAEVYVSKIMNREEFRQHCDKYLTVDEIVANLPGAHTEEPDS